MANYIHPTALVSETALLGDGNYIGPFCLIGPNVEIGNENRFEAYVSIGTAGEHRDHFHSEPGKVKIGDRNVIREYVTINGGTQGVTEVGSFAVILRGSHVGHDAIIRDRANLSCNVLIGGHTIVGKGANLGLAVVVHQSRAVGAYSMIGMNSTATRNVLPFSISFGSPSRSQRINRIGLQRAGVADIDLVTFENWFQQLDDEQAPIKPLPHPFNKYLDQYLADCRKFHIAAENKAA